MMREFDVEKLREKMGEGAEFMKRLVEMACGDNIDTP